jgi:hypothetical protein
MDFTTGSPSEEALSQLIESLINFIVREGLYESLTAPGTESEAVS